MILREGSLKTQILLKCMILSKYNITTLKKIRKMKCS